MYELRELVIMTPQVLLNMLFCAIDTTVPPHSPYSYKRKHETAGTASCAAQLWNVKHTRMHKGTLGNYPHVLGLLKYTRVGQDAGGDQHLPIPHKQRRS